MVTDFKEVQRPKQHDSITILQEVTRIACKEGVAFSDPLQTHFMRLIRMRYPNLDKLSVGARGHVGTQFEFAGITKDVGEIQMALLEVASMAGLRSETSFDVVDLHDGREGINMKMTFSI